MGRSCLGGLLGGDTGVNFGGSPEEAGEESAPSPGMPPSGHPATQGCLLLVSGTGNGDLVVG